MRTDSWLPRSMMQGGRLVEIVSSQDRYRGAGHAFCFTMGSVQTIKSAYKRVR